MARSTPLRKTATKASASFDEMRAHALEADLGRMQFDTAKAEGRGLSLEEAVAYALGAAVGGGLS